MHVCVLLDAIRCVPLRFVHASFLSVFGSLLLPLPTPPHTHTHLLFLRPCDPQSRQHLAPAAADRVRALACMAVLGLARDASIRHILTKLQVCWAFACWEHPPRAFFVTFFQLPQGRMCVLELHQACHSHRTFALAFAPTHPLSHRHQRLVLEAVMHLFVYACVCCDLQVGKLLAELVREPLGPGAAGGSSSRREVNAGSEAGASGNTGES